MIKTATPATPSVKTVGIALSLAALASLVALTASAIPRTAGYCVGYLEGLERGEAVKNRGQIITDSITSPAIDA